MKYFHVIIDYIFVQLENTNEKKNTARQVESRWLWLLEVRINYVKLIKSTKNRFDW